MVRWSILAFLEPAVRRCGFARLYRCDRSYGGASGSTSSGPGCRQRPSASSDTRPASCGWRRSASGKEGRHGSFARRWVRMRPSSRSIPIAFDFILIDGDHTCDGLKKDWEAWRELIGKRGIVALHDSVKPTGSAGAGSVDYSNDVIARDSRFETLEEAWTLRVLRRMA
jgi:hypothetical protein